MSTVKNVAEFLARIETLRQRAEFVTNYVRPLKELESKVSDGLATCVTAEQVIYFVEPSPDFERLHFFCNGMSPLRTSLLSLSSVKTGGTIVDLVGKETTVFPLRSCLESAGFTLYRRFVRMVRTSGELPECAPENDFDIRAACPEHAIEVYGLLSEGFDPRSEHVPTIEEVRQAIRAGTILAAFVDSGIAALLFYERHGFSSTLRFWLVTMGFRCQGFGDALLRRYLTDCASCARFLLWVRDDNSPALRHYRHYGYVPDGTVDLIMLKHTPTYAEKNQCQNC